LLGGLLLDLPLSFKKLLLLLHDDTVLEPIERSLCVVYAAISHGVRVFEKRPFFCTIDIFSIVGES
jgi:hypothetical protein